MFLDYLVDKGLFEDPFGSILLNFGGCHSVEYAYRLNKQIFPDVPNDLLKVRTHFVFFIFLPLDCLLPEGFQQPLLPFLNRLRFTISGFPL